MELNLELLINQNLSYMLEAYIKGDSETFELAFGCIKDLVNSKEFNKAIDAFEKDFENKVKTHDENAVKDALKPGNIKTLDDLILIATTGIETRKAHFNKFIEDVKTYTVLYCKTV